MNAKVKKISRVEEEKSEKTGDEKNKVKERKIITKGK
jgi:hypothetical protein